MSSHGTVVARVSLYKAGVVYFSAEHIPYAILAIIVLMFCNVLPLQSEVPLLLIQVCALCEHVPGGVPRSL